MNKIFVLFLMFSMIAYSQIEAMTGSSSPPSAQKKPSAPLPPPPPSIPSKPLPKRYLPKMSRPYGMPGVVGLKNEKWIGTDYLGYLSTAIGVNVEVITTGQAPSLDASSLEAKMADILSKADLKPESEKKEGPPLPFLQILLMVFPVEKQTYAIFGGCRLFEEIQVVRKDFTPAGFWQGITWESQNVILTNEENFKEKVEQLVEGLTRGFVKRYTLFNQNKNSMDH